MNLRQTFGRPGVLAVMLLAIAFGCARVPVRSPAAPAPNHALLDEVHQAGAWFHARKTREIWVRRLERDEVIPTLEGSLEGRAGDFVCRGAGGELWPQKAPDVERKYLATDTADGPWRKYVPRPDAEGILAARIAHPFNVEATWGRLSGKSGDYLAKNFRDRDVRYPADVWVIDRALFDATYERVPEGR